MSLFARAEDAEEASPRRSLVLSGGGIRVAYQAGALRALEEAGLAFHHFDATSGGSLNQAMLFSGLDPRELWTRWQALDLYDTIALLPPKDYLHVGQLPAAGSACGMRDKVIPGLGIDFARIHAVQGVTGTFNLLDFTHKVNRVLTHDQLDLDHLVAGFSLPGMLPPVEIGGELFLDSAFVQDANLLEAERRGADEAWLVWCLGNAPVWRTGPLGIYLNMLEITANGTLNLQMSQLRELNARVAAGDTPGGRRRPIRLHLILPEYPLPLDPDLYLGKIDQPTLLDMGYSDARRYLANRSPEGVPLTPESLLQKRFGTGIILRETLSGNFALGESDPQAGARRGKAAKTRMTLSAAIRIPDLDAFLSDPQHAALLTGRVSVPGLGDELPGWNGACRLLEASGGRSRKTTYELSFGQGEEAYFLVGERLLRDDPGFDLVKDVTTLAVRLHRGSDRSGEVVGAGILELGITGLIRLLSHLCVTDAQSAAEHATALARFGRFYLGQLWDTYAKHLPRASG